MVTGALKERASREFLLSFGGMESRVRVLGEKGKGKSGVGGVFTLTWKKPWKQSRSFFGVWILE